MALPHCREEYPNFVATLRENFFFYVSYTLNNDAFFDHTLYIRVLKLFILSFTFEKTQLSSSQEEIKSRLLRCHRFKIYNPSTSTKKYLEIPNIPKRLFNVSTVN